MTFKYIAPLLSTDAESPKIDFGRGVTITETPDFLEGAFAIAGFNDNDRKKKFAEAPMSFVVDIQGDEPPISDDGSSLTQMNASQYLMLHAAFACWLSEALYFRPWAYFLVEESPQGTAFIRHFAEAPMIVGDFPPRQQRPDAVRMALASELFAACADLTPDKLVHTSVAIINRTLLERNLPVRYMLLWIVLEGLFGPKGGGETSYRLCLRLSVFLDKHETTFGRHPYLADMTAKDIFTVARKGYGLRSKIVHGDYRPRKVSRDEFWEHIHELEDLVRCALEVILLSDDLLHSFESNGRDAFLDEIVFK